MKPFDKEYVFDKIEEYNKKIKSNKVGDYEIKSVDGLQGVIQGYLHSKEDNYDINILELHAPNHVWMRLTPLEIQGAYFAIKMAKGKVGVPIDVQIAADVMVGWNTPTIVKSIENLVGK